MADRLREFVDAASVDPAVFELRPDYRVLLIAVDGITPGESDEASEAFLAEAETAARRELGEGKPEDLPHGAAWREAFRAFGAKPQRTRNSMEALIRRAPDGLPRINRLTDIYNAVCVKHQLPLGGEDLDTYEGALRLVRATGEEDFATMAEGGTLVEHPEPGEVVWRDDAGVTCRRWNWRQCHRTALTDATTTAIFILDCLDPMTDEQLEAAGDDLLEHLKVLGPDVRAERRVIRNEG